MGRNATAFGSGAGRVEVDGVEALEALVGRFIGCSGHSGVRTGEVGLFLGGGGWFGGVLGGS